MKLILEEEKRIYKKKIQQLKLSKYVQFGAVVNIYMAESL